MRSRRGTSLVEVMVALVIVAVGLLPVVYVSRRYFQPARSKTF